jgi:hypothetical protein
MTDALAKLLIEKGIITEAESLVSWKFANHSGEETLVHTDLHFGTVEEAMRAGVEFAIKWIDNGKQDFLTER